MATEEAEEKYYSISSGDALPPERLRDVAAKDETTVVLVAGPVESGKTTILVSLYELFNEGPVGGLIFGGSETLVGFEEICHPGRVTSGQLTPTTVRTSRAKGAAFLHIRVANTTSGTLKPASLLVSDVTGEAFTEARDNSEPTIITPDIWRRADTLCIVLDGQQVNNPSRRNVVRSQARSLLRVAKESNFLSKKCRLSILTTKWDQVTTKETEDFVDETEKILVTLFGSNFESCSFHHIAARPTSPTFSYAFGVPELLVEWMKRDSKGIPIAVPKNRDSSGLNRFSEIFWQEHGEQLSGAIDVVK